MDQQKPLLDSEVDPNFRPVSNLMLTLNCLWSNGEGNSYAAVGVLSIWRSSRNLSVRIYHSTDTAHLQVLRAIDNKTCQQPSRRSTMRYYCHAAMEFT